MLGNGKLCWLLMIDIFIAIDHSAFKYASFSVLFVVVFFALKFCQILTKDFFCLNSDKLRKPNPSFEGFSVTGEKYG